MPNPLDRIDRKVIDALVKKYGKEKALEIITEYIKGKAG
jgi:hypothetical protein